MFKHRQGFTLIELLVVIGIIGILLGLTLPPMYDSIRRAHLTTCTNNLRQIGMALNAYAQDWNGCIPPYSTWKSGTYTTWETDPPTIIDFRPFNDAKALKRCLGTYGASDGVWWCPSDGRPDPDIDIHPSSPNCKYDTSQSSYAINCRVSIWQPVRMDDPPALSKADWEAYQPRPCMFWCAGEKQGVAILPYANCVRHTVGSRPTNTVLNLDGSVHTVFMDMGE